MRIKHQIDDLNCLGTIDITGFLKNRIFFVLWASARDVCRNSENFRWKIKVNKIRRDTQVVEGSALEMR